MKSLDMYIARKPYQEFWKGRINMFLKPLKRIVENGSRFWNHYNTSIKSHVGGEKSHAGEFCHLKKEQNESQNITLKRYWSRTE